MKITSSSISDGAPIAPRFAFGKPDPDTHFALSENVTPHLAWSGAPAGTRSFVLICHDVDVPTVFDDANQPGRTIAHDLPRMDFTHWVLVDIPASVTELAEGAQAGVVAGGKAPGPGPVGRQGINDFTGWFAGDPNMGGDYGGYDGPPPPWNDERLHRYFFTVYALDVDSLPVDGSFTRADALAAMEGHVLAEASIHGTYAINPDLHGK